MKNVFLDLGTHYGQGLREFIHRFNMNDSWIIHTFEANPITYNLFMKNFHSITPWVIPHNLAITNCNGEIQVNVETPPGEGETGMGTSIIDLKVWDPWNGQTKDNFKTQYMIESIDLSEFIKENFDANDNIIVKMDIEGSEYDTLEKMIESDTLRYISFIAVEWHSRFFVNRDEIYSREKNIIQYMQTHGINLESWK